MRAAAQAPPGQVYPPTRPDSGTGREGVESNRNPHLTGVIWQLHAWMARSRATGRPLATNFDLRLFY
jgi:hypothetical protein